MGRAESDLVRRECARDSNLAGSLFAGYKRIKPNKLKGAEKLETFISIPEKRKLCLSGL